MITAHSLGFDQMQNSKKVKNKRSFFVFNSTFGGRIIIIASKGGCSGFILTDKGVGRAGGAFL